MSRAAATGIVLGTALFVAIQALLGALVDPQGFYAPGAEPVLPAGSSPAPGRGVLDARTVAALETAPFVRTAVAETFHYTLVQGETVIVRGANLTALLALHDARVTGALPGSEDVLVGERLAARLDLRVGDRVLVPASQGPDVLVAEVTGVVHARSGLADELLVDRATGDRLAGLRGGAAHFVEVVPADRDALHAWLDATRSESPLVLHGPDAARADGNVTLRVTRAAGGPVAGATLHAPDQDPVVTDAQGRAVVPVTEGRVTWTATADGHAPATLDLLGVTRNDTLRVTDVTVSPAHPVPDRAFTLTLTVRNFAAHAANASFPVTVDDAVVATATVDLAGGALGTVNVTATAPESGVHRASADGFTVEFQSATPDELLAQWRLVPVTGKALRTVAMQDALDDVFGSIALAGFLMGALAFLLFFVGNAALFARLVHAREADLRLVRALGANRWQVRAFALRALAPFAVATALAGLAVGVAGAEAFTRANVLTLFGHALLLDWAPERVLALTALALLCTVGAVGVAVEAFLRRERARYERPPTRTPHVALEEVVAE